MRTTTLITPQPRTPLTGYAVYTSDHEPVGRIVAVGLPVTVGPSASDASDAGVFRVRPGIVQRLVMRAGDVVVPQRLVRMVQPGAKQVILRVPKAELLVAESSDHSA